MLKLHNADVKLDDRGILTILEFSNLPWKPLRTYFLSGSNPSQKRGTHAHKSLQQYFMALSGSWELRFYDGNEWSSFNLSQPGSGLLVGPGLWREISTEDSSAVLSVFASAAFDESDYIRDFQDYEAWRNL